METGSDYPLRIRRPFTFTSASCNVVSRSVKAAPGILHGQKLLPHGRNGFDPTKNSGQYINPAPLNLRPASRGLMVTWHCRSVTSTYGRTSRHRLLADQGDEIPRQSELRVHRELLQRVQQPLLRQYRSTNRRVFRLQYRGRGTGFGQWNGTVSSPRTVQFSARLEF